MAPRIAAIDLFCGGGGMTLGARQAGIDVLFAVERCPVAAATYRRNFPGTAIYVGDIRNVDSLPEKPTGAKTVVFGGPPAKDSRHRTSAQGTLRTRTTGCTEN